MSNLKRVFLVLSICCATAMAEAENLYITTNKSIYVVGEQILFDVSVFDTQGMLSEDSVEQPIAMDLVAPDGQIVQTKSLIKEEDDCYFFSLADSLETGVYRLIANGAGVNQSTKRVHVFALQTEETAEYKASKIAYKVQGNTLVSGLSNKVALQVTGESGSGIRTKGTLTNSSGSLIQYLDTDPNGVASFELIPRDSLYRVRFGAQTLTLTPAVPSFHCILDQQGNDLVLNLSQTAATKDSVSILIDEKLFGRYLIESLAEEIRIPKGDLGNGIHRIMVRSNSGVERSFYEYIRPNVSGGIAFKKQTIGNNEQGEFAIDDTTDQIERLSVSVLDQNTLINFDTDFYEDFFFDQLSLDLQLVSGRDFEAYLLLFYGQLQRSVNQERVDLIGKKGVLSYKQEYPFDEVSMLNLNTLRAVDQRCESIRGIHDFESKVGSSTRIFPYHFTTYLQPIKLAVLDEKIDYSYPALSARLLVGEKERALLENYDLQKNIRLSYQPQAPAKNQPPKPDFVYDLDEYEIPNTMTDLINYLIKYVSVKKGEGGSPELSMFRYASSYKYRGTPLIFINGLPTYDAQTLINLNPKDFAKVEVRNSYQANGHLGNFSLNGSISFFLKEGIDNPLEAAYADLPFIESCLNFSKRSSKNEHAPDFRHQLYWNPRLAKVKDSFWVDLKSSDLSTTYQVQITAFMKDGTVVHDRSELVVK